MVFFPQERLSNLEEHNGGNDQKKDRVASKPVEP